MFDTRSLRRGTRHSDRHHVSASLCPRDLLQYQNKTRLVDDLKVNVRVSQETVPGVGKTVARWETVSSHKQRQDKYTRKSSTNKHTTPQPKPLAIISQLTRSLGAIYLANTDISQARHEVVISDADDSAFDCASWTVMCYVSIIIRT